MRNRWKCAVAYLFVMVLLAGFVPGQNILVDSVRAIAVDSSAGASSDASADVSVTIADKGNFAVGKDENHTLMLQVPVHVTDVDEDGALTFNDAMIITHEQYCEDGYSLYEGSLFVSKLWRDESGNFGYYVDDESAWDAKEPIHEGSDIVAFIHTVKNPNQYDNYSYFKEKEYSVKTNEDITLNLMMQGYDENWETITLPCASATLGTVTVSSGNAQFTSMDKVTDASGNATISFNKPGTYVVSARETASAEAAIVPPACVIKVEKNASDASADVSVTIADKGNFAVGKDANNTLMARVPVHVIDVDEDGALTFNDAMIITHEEYCKDGYSSSVGDYGLSVDKLWGDKSGNFGYYVDDTSAWSAAQPIKEGSDIVAFIHKTKTHTYTNYDNYSYFKEKEYSVKTNEDVTLNLMMQEYDENWETITLPCTSATLGTVAVSSGNAQFTPMDKVTDASGNATISFDKPGTYVVSAKEADSAEAAIVPPACVVHVEQAETQPPVNPEEPKQQETPTEPQTQAQQTVTDTPDTTVTVTGPDAKAVALQKTTQKLSSVQSKKAKQITVKFKKNKKATAYQVQYSTSKKFTKKTTKTLLVKKTTYTIKKLKSKKTYYVRVRSVRTVNGKNYYGKYSKVKKITVK